MKITAQEIVNALIGHSSDKIWVQELAIGNRYVDFWTLEPHRSKHYRAVAYEIKISRGDFFKDDEEKQKYALQYSDRFFYVTPPGMLKKEEIPSWAGLMEWNGSTFHVVKRAPKRDKDAPTWDVIVSMFRYSENFSRDIDQLKVYKAQAEYWQRKCENYQRQLDVKSTRKYLKMLKTTPRAV